MLWKKIFNNVWLEFLGRCLLGGVFIYASYHKIAEPAEFAKIIYGYKILPGSLINFLAIFLPFFEFVAGFSLMLGFFPRAGASLINVMLIIFITAIGFNLLRGHEFDCGCFSNSADVHQSPRYLLLRDILYFSIGLMILLFQKARKFCMWPSL